MVLKYILGVGNVSTITAHSMVASGLALSAVYSNDLLYCAAYTTLHPEHSDAS